MSKIKNLYLIADFS